MVEIYKTNVDSTDEAGSILMKMKFLFPFSAINFDLEDCDRILRVEADVISHQDIIAAMIKLGYSCVALL